MKLLKRFLIRLAFYPTLAASHLMCWLGIWHKWDWIDDTILLGVVPGRKDVHRLHARGIRTIVNLCDEFAGYPDEYAALGIRQLRLPSLDYHEPLEADLLRGVEFVRAAIARGEKVLMHCKAGRGRAPTLALCYLMVTREWTALQALAHLRAARRQVCGWLNRYSVVRSIEQRVQAGAGSSAAPGSPGHR